MRAYHHCAPCRAGFAPRDAALRLEPDRLTSAAREAVAMAGAAGPFAGAAERLLPKLAGIKVSESTVGRRTKAVGGKIDSLLKAGRTFDRKVDWAWNEDAEGRTVAYLSVDSTGVGVQGPGGTKAEGRMVAVGMVYNAGAADGGGTARLAEARYLAGLQDFAELGPRLRRQAGQVGMDRADRWVALTDGGAGLEEFVRVNFPRAECVLDYWHAAGHVAAFAEAYEPAGKRDLTHRWCRTMKRRGGAALLKTLERLDLAGRPAETVERHRLLTGYVENNLRRMDYPKYLARGWHIGSGPVESACKTVIGTRMKGGGMRWGTGGADQMAHVRALFRSEPGQWDAFWAGCIH